MAQTSAHCTYPTVSDKKIPIMDSLLEGTAKIFCGDTVTHLKQYTTTEWFT